MRRIGIFLALCLSAIGAQAQSANLPTFVRVVEFKDVHTAAFDSSFAEFRAYLGTRAGFWSYSYYAGDNGHRYLAATLTGVGEIQRHDSITAAFSQAMPNGEAFGKRYSASWGSFDQTIWRSIPALSMLPAGMTSAQISAKYPFRRSSIRYLRPGTEQAFEAALRDAKAQDEKLGVAQPMVVYIMVIGAGDPAYLIISYAESAKAYWDLNETRRVKRLADPTWADISRRINATQRSVENVSLTRNAALSYVP